MQAVYLGEDGAGVVSLVGRGAFWHELGGQLLGVPASVHQPEKTLNLTILAILANLGNM